MQRVTFGKFLDRTITHERMPVSIHPGLRRGVWLSEVLLCVCSVIYQFLPSGSYARSAFFFLWKNDWLASTWDFTADYRLHLILTCSIVLIITLGLMVPTHLYRIGEISFHAVLFVQVVFSAVNLLFAFILIIPLLINLALWVFIIMFGIFLFFITSMIFFRWLAH